MAGEAKVWVDAYGDEREGILPVVRLVQDGREFVSPSDFYLHCYGDRSLLASFDHGDRFERLSGLSPEAQLRLAPFKKPDLQNVALQVLVRSGEALSGLESPLVLPTIALDRKKKKPFLGVVESRPIMGRDPLLFEDALKVARTRNVELLTRDVFLDLCAYFPGVFGEVKEWVIGSSGQKEKAFFCFGMPVTGDAGVEESSSFDYRFMVRLPFDEASGEERTVFRYDDSERGRDGFPFWHLPFHPGGY